MAEDFSDISDGEVVCATQLVEELYGDDATDADLVVASQQFDIASESVRDSLRLLACARLLNDLVPHHCLKKNLKKNLKN